MRLPAVCRFDLALVLVSVALAVVFSYAALRMAFYFRSEPKKAALRQLAGAMFMGVAIAAMHYTGMAAARFTGSELQPHLSHTIGVSHLATTGIATVTLILLGLAILTCRIDRELQAKELQIALEQARAEVAHVNRIASMGELTASIAHEINQPLAAVVMGATACLNWLSTEPPSVTEAKTAATRALEQAMRAHDIVVKIRGMFTKAPISAEVLDIRQIISDVLAWVSTELARREVLVRTEFAEDTPPVRGDRVQLQQVILNLVTNAIDAMRSTSDRSRELIVRSRKNGNSVIVEIEDSGPGLAPEQAERVFQPFYTTKSHGLGMGLAVSRSIVESHQGHLSVSRRNSHGAIFQLDLPSAGGER
jgi:C4-dicarboxylate-specific signal transduction histidine kinase